MTKTGTQYGILIRAKRGEAGLSLRGVADAIGVSHAYLAEVERGSRGPLQPEREKLLIDAIPGLDQRELDRARAVSKPVQIQIDDAPPAYQDVTLALARRVENRDLRDEDLQELLAVLRGRTGGRDE